MSNNPNFELLLENIGNLDYSIGAEVFISKYLHLICESLSPNTGTCYLFFNQEEEFDNDEENDTTCYSIFSSNEENNENKNVILTEDEKYRLLSADIIEKKDYEYISGLDNIKKSSSSNSFILTLRHDKNLLGFFVFNLNGEESISNSEKFLLKLLSQELSLQIFHSSFWAYLNIQSPNKLFSITDPLSDSYTKAYFDQRISQELKETVRYKRDYAFSLVEIDSFNDIKTKHGEQLTNVVIQKVGKLIKGMIRHDVDIVGKYSENSFILAFPFTGISGASILSQRLRSNVPIIYVSDNEKLNITFSIGITELEKNDVTRNKIVEKLEQALNYSKENGGDRVSYNYKNEISDKQLTGANMLTDEFGNDIDFTATMKNTNWYNYPKY